MPLQPNLGCKQVLKGGKRMLLSNLNKWFRSCSLKKFWQQTEDRAWLQKLTLSTLCLDELTRCQMARMFFLSKFDLEGWPWHINTQHVQLFEIHVHAKYKMSKCYSFWPIYFTLTIPCHQSTCEDQWDTCACKVWGLYRYWFKKL